MAIGAAFGFAGGLALGIPGCGFDCPTGPPKDKRFSWSDAMLGAAMMTPLMAGLGAGVDGLIRPRRTIYVPLSSARLRLAPQWSGDRVGLTASLTFHPGGDTGPK